MKYKFITIALILGIMMSYLSFSIATDIGNQLAKERKSREELLNYKYDYTYFITGTACDERVFQPFSSETEPISLCNVLLFLDEVNKVFACKVYLNDVSIDALNYRFVSGGLPTYNDGPSVVLGINLKQYTYQKNGVDYIHICKEEYRVSGYVSDGKSVLYDNAAILFWNHMGEQVQEDILQSVNTIYGGYLRLQSNTNDMQYVMRNCHEELTELGLSATQVPYYEEAYDTIQVKTNYRKYIYLMYIFSVIILFLVIELWMHQRYKELLIRRMIGYERTQLIGMIAKELLSMLIGITMIMEGLHFIIDIFVLHKLIDIYYLNRALLLFAIVILTFLILMIYPFVFVFKIDIAKQFGKAERMS